MDIRINLLPDHRRPYLTYLLISLLAVILILLAAWTVMEYARLSQRSQELADNIDRMQVMYESIVQEWETASNHLSEINYLIYYDKLVTELGDFWYPPDRLMDELIRLLAPGARIHQLAFNYNGEVNLLVRCHSRDEVADYLDRLDTSSLVLSSELVSISMQPSGETLAQINLRMVTTTDEANG